MEEDIEAELLESALHDIDFSPLTQGISKSSAQLPGFRPAVSASTSSVTQVFSAPRCNISNVKDSLLECPSIQSIPSGSFSTKCLDNAELILGRSPDSHVSKMACMAPARSNDLQKDEKPSFSRAMPIQASSHQTGELVKPRNVRYANDHLKPVKRNTMDIRDLLQQPTTSTSAPSLSLPEGVERRPFCYLQVSCLYRLLKITRKTLHITLQ